MSLINPTQWTLVGQISRRLYVAEKLLAIYLTMDSSPVDLGVSFHKMPLVNFIARFHSMEAWAILVISRMAQTPQQLCHTLLDLCHILLRELNRYRLVPGRP